jgi:hypothetical protein
MVSSKAFPDQNDANKRYLHIQFVSSGLNSIINVAFEPPSLGLIPHGVALVVITIFIAPGFCEGMVFFLKLVSAERNWTVLCMQIKMSPLSKAA